MKFVVAVLVAGLCTVIRQPSCAQTAHEQSNSLADLAALLNNLEIAMQIFGIAAPIALLVGAITIVFLKKWSVAAKLGGFGLVVLMMSCATPGWFHHWMLAEIRDAALPMGPEPWLWGFSILFCIAALVVFAVVYCLPSIVAFKRKKRNKTSICVLNIVLGLLPFGWNVALVLSFMDDGERSVP